MGKKRRVDLNGAPLQSVTIGQVSEHKYGWIGIVVLFAIFLALIYFLPELNALYQQYIQGSPSASQGAINNTVNNVVPTPDVPVEDDEFSEPELVLLEFGKDASLSIENVTYENIVLANGNLSFSVVNSSMNTFEFKDTFISLYSDEKQFVRAIAIDGMLNASETKTFNFALTETQPYFIIGTILEEDYTYIDLPIDDNKISTLNCSRGNESIIYTFVDEKLNKVVHNTSFSLFDNEYSNLYNKYNSLIIKYGNQLGVTASLVTNDFDVDFNLEVDYTMYNTTMDEKYYFTKNNTPRVVNFIMEANLFDCK